MNPPIKVTAHTDNLNKCELRIAGAEGVAVALAVPSSGNVYSGLHGVAPELELVINDILAFHGINAPEPPSERPPVDLQAKASEVEALEAEVNRRKLAQELDERAAAARAELETLPDPDEKPAEPEHTPDAPPVSS